MCSRKSVGPRMEPWGTPTLIGYFCEDFPSRTTGSRLLLRKEEEEPNIWLDIPQDVKVHQGTLINLCPQHFASVLTLLT